MTTSDPALTDIGARIRALREYRDLTQATLAEAVGLSRASIANMEAGRQGDVPVTKLIQIAMALDATVGALVGEVELNLPVVAIITEFAISCTACGGIVEHGITGSLQDAEDARSQHARGHRL